MKRHKNCIEEEKKYKTRSLISLKGYWILSSILRQIKWQKKKLLEFESEISTQRIFINKMLFSGKEKKLVSIFIIFFFCNILQRFFLFLSRFST